MEDKGEPALFTWVEDTDDVYAPVRQKRKYTPKKMEYVGWGSKPLIDFLKYLEKDVREQISQHDVSDIVNEYVREKNLLHPTKKKKVVCDDRLHSLFGKKMINRIKIYDLLEPHYAENIDSENDMLYSSDENEKNTAGMYGKEKSEKKSDPRKKVREIPKSSFAAVVPENVKLIYLKRSLVEDLSKDPESFESKIVGSFVRIKSDPNDYLQKNSHLLVQVTGVKKGTGSSDANTEIVLQVSYAHGEIQICKLSDNNFSEEECEDLRHRVKYGLLKRMTVGELEQKAQILHGDITKHWLVRELALLQSQIDRANEKGWRREMFEHMERRDLLQTPSKQAELLQEVRQVIAEELETQAISQESSKNESEELAENIAQISNNSHRSNPMVTRILSTSAAVWSETVASQTPARTNFAEVAALPPDMPHITEECINASANLIPHMEIAGEDRAEDRTIRTKNSDGSVFDNIQIDAHENQQLKLAVAPQHQKNRDLQLPDLNSPPVIIDLSDDNEDEGFLDDHNVPDEGKVWHYLDPRGNVQGPFPVTSLKEWFDLDYFPPDFKIWKKGQSQEEGVCIIDLLRQMFPISYR